MTLEFKTVTYGLSDNSISGSMYASNYGGCSKAWNVTSGGTSWADVTTAINNTTSSDITLGGAVGDTLYIGCSSPFLGSYCPGPTSTVGGSAVGEIWDGSAWVAVPNLSRHLLTSGQTISWDMPTTWSTTQVNSESDGPHYYFRLRIVTARTTAGNTSWFAPATVQQVANARSIVIPETTNRTIKNAFVRVSSIFDNNGQAGLVNLYAAGRFGADSYTQLITKSAGYVAGSFSKKFMLQHDVDVTTLVTNAFTGSVTAANFDLQYAYSCNAPSNLDTLYRNQSAGELYITYAADDSNTTQINTVTVGSPSLSGTLTTSHQQIATIPQITGSGGILAETGVTIKDFYIVFKTNIDEDGTTDWDLYTKLDSETETLLAQNNAPLTSDSHHKFFWRRMDIDFGASHSVNARVTSNTGAKCPNIACMFVVTYTYNGSSTRLTRTIETPIIVTEDQLDTTNYLTFSIDVPAENVSAACNIADISWVENNHSAVTIGVSGYNSVIYKNDQIDGTTSMAGNYTVNHQFPAISRGTNTYTVSSSQTNNLNNTAYISGILYSTFSFDKDSGGGKICNTKVCVCPSDVGYATSPFSSYTITNMPISGDYYVNSVGVRTGLLSYPSTNNIVMSTMIKPNTNSNYISSLNSSVLVKDVYTQFLSTVKKSDCHKKYAEEPSDFMLPSADTVIKNGIPASTIKLLSNELNINWHTYRWTVGGTVSGSSGGTVTLTLHDSATGKLLQKTTRSGNGSYSFSHYENIRDVYVVAIENDTYKGASKQDLAGTSDFDINLTSGGAAPSVKRCYVWGG